MERNLYRLIAESDYVESAGWSENSFLVYVEYLWIDIFIEKMINIFSTSIFDEGRAKATLLEYGICFDLCELVGYFIELEEVFPKSKFKY